MSTLPDILNRAYENHLKPKKELSVDEQMITTKSRVPFIQYMPKKSKKFGVKLWAICEASSDYCLKFQIYKGKEKGTVKKELGKKVVLDLMQGYFQNFYTSPQLFNRLEGKQTYAC